jgi:ectoine hydroxylase-related dioxygenase (phytanoyl-CoA dioxygenase family)
MTPGSVLFFHCNTLHTSAANNSDHHRRAFIVCYTGTSNPQYRGDVFKHIRCARRVRPTRFRASPESVLRTTSFVDEERGFKKPTCGFRRRKN